jgi:pSer/pThr/pTyr-binding forkhead associated (FHA) protein
MNPAGAAQCLYCGSLLNPAGGNPITTIPVVTAQPEIVIRQSERLQQLAQYPAGALVLFIMDEAQPVIIENLDRLILGRNVTDMPPVDFDLTPYGAADLGVSRQHALITASGTVCAINDLGSTNGTWINRSRLTAHKAYPLHSGYEVQLGNLRLYTYYRSAAAVAGGAEEILLLVEAPTASTMPHPRLTARYLAATLYPYLQAIGELQRLLDQTQGQLPREAIINTISAVREDLPIGVSMTGVSEAIRITRELITPWREKHAAALGALFAQQSALDPGAEPAGSNATRIFTEAADAGRPSPLEPELALLAEAVGARLALSQAPEPEFLAPLRALATSRLQAMTEKLSEAG